MQVNIVTNFQILQEIKKSKYFQVNLGFIPTVEKNGQRVFNDQDKFSQVYNGNYKTTIIRFYTDHYIQDPIMGVYYGDTFEEFVVDFDNKLLREKSIDGYLGYIIKGVEEQYDVLLKENALKKVEEKPKGDAEKLTNNPGSVTWDDVKAFLEKERLNKRI